MKGYVDEFGQPKVEVTFMGPWGKVITEAIIDTGFNGEVSLPVPIAVRLGLRLKGTQEVMLADGSRKSSLVFAGQIVLDGAPEDTLIFLSDLNEPLLGTQLLGNRLLKIDFSKNEVYICPRRSSDDNAMG